MATGKKMFASNGTEGSDQYSALSASAFFAVCRQRGRRTGSSAPGGKLSEVVASQRAMLVRQSKTGAALPIRS
jgi:hypothetical protein